MSTLVDVSRRPLAGAWQKVAVAVWAVIFGLSLLSLVLSLISYNIWDRTPAANLPAFYPDMTQENITAKSAFQDEVLRMGFSLASFAGLFTALRLVGGLALFGLSALVMRRSSDHLMAVLLAILLLVMGAGGIWTGTLFGASPGLFPWFSLPAQVLSILLWFGLILLYVFPNGRFTPRWTVWLVVLLVPVVISLIFELSFFLNPDTWPDPLPLLPNLVFIGVGFYSILYRYTHTTYPAERTGLRGFTLGMSLLMGLYFILFFLNTVFPTVTGVDLFPTMRAVLVLTLVSEALWYGLEVVFAVLTYRSIFRDGLFEVNQPTV